MGSVQYEENCRKCGEDQSLMVDCFYNRGVEYAMCNHCGYAHEANQHGIKKAPTYGLLSIKSRKLFGRYTALDKRKRHKLPAIIQRQKRFAMTPKGRNADIVVRHFDVKAKRVLRELVISKSPFKMKHVAIKPWIPIEEEWSEDIQF